MTDKKDSTDHDNVEIDEDCFYLQIKYAKLEMTDEIVRSVSKKAMQLTTDNLALEDIEEMGRHYIDYTNLKGLNYPKNR